MNNEKPPIATPQVEEKSKKIQNDKAVDFIQKYLGSDAGRFSSILTEDLNASELASVLLYIFQKRIEKFTPREILDNYKKNRFLRPSRVDALELAKTRVSLMESLPSSFEILEVSPLVPVGSSSVLTNIDSKTVLQTIRSSEVISDMAVSLALEVARRRVDNKLWNTSERGNINNIDLAASYKELRTQNISLEYYNQHFSSFTLASSGRYIRHEGFEKEALIRHLEYWLDYLNKFDDAGYGIKKIRVFISDIKILESLIDTGIIDRESVIGQTRKKTDDLFETAKIGIPGKITDINALEYTGTNKDLLYSIGTLKRLEEKQIVLLKNKFPQVEFVYDLSRLAGIGYYNGICYKIKATNENGVERSLIDGGASDWVAKLTSDKKECFFSSGFGLEVFINHFKV